MPKASTTPARAGSPKIPYNNPTPVPEGHGVSWNEGLRLHIPRLPTFVPVETGSQRVLYAVFISCVPP